MPGREPDSAVTARWRPANPSDDDDIVAMSGALNREDPGPRPVPAAHVRGTLAALRENSGRGRAAVLEIEGRAAGYAFLIGYWSNELGGEVCTIDELYIALDFRGRGLGTRLIGELAAGGGIVWPNRPVALALETTPANDRARGFYDRLGFSGGNLAMVRRLDPAPDKAGPEDDPALLVELRPFRPETDLKRLDKWLDEPAVSRWWGDKAPILEEVRRDPPGGGHALIVAGGTEVGYIRWQVADRGELEEAGLSKLPQGSMDIDIMIGEPEFIGRGIGPRAVALLCQTLLADPSVPLVGMATSISNRAAIRAFQKAGLNPWREFADPLSGPCVYLVKWRASITSFQVGF